MNILLQVVLSFSILGCIGIISLYSYSKRTSFIKFNSIIVLKRVVIAFCIATTLFAMAGCSATDNTKTQVQNQETSVTDKVFDSGKYTGALKNGKMNGQGTFNYTNGDVYSGNYENGLRSGKGTFTWKVTKDKYIGDWSSDEMNGQGTYTFGSGKNSGDKYVGSWVNNKMEGKGTYTYSNGKTITGTWKDNKCIEQSK